MVSTASQHYKSEDCAQNLFRWPFHPRHIFVKDSTPGIRGLWGLELTYLVLQRQKKKKSSSMCYCHLLTPSCCIRTESVLVLVVRPSALHNSTTLIWWEGSKDTDCCLLLPICCMRWQEDLFRFGFHCWKWSDQITAHNGAQSKKLQWDFEAFQSTYPNAYSSCFTVNETIINTEQQKLIPICRILFS